MTLRRQHRTDPVRRTHPRRAALGAGLAGTALLATTTLLATTALLPSSPRTTPHRLLAADTAVTPLVHTIALPPAETPTEAGGAQVLSAADTRTQDTGTSTGIGPRTTAPFSLLGLTWPTSSTPLAGTVRVRTRTRDTGTWSPWRRVDTAEGDPSEAREATRAGTEPLWVGPSDGVEVHLDARADTLSSGLRLDLVDPDPPLQPVPQARGASVDQSSVDQSSVDQSSVDQGTVDQASTAQQEVTVAATAVAAPSVVRRSGWKADERLRDSGAPQYTSSVKVVLVHHTAGTNSYTCGESASLVRGIYAYHVTSKGWRDIGYNYLVDRCGTIFEGRHGGITRPVVGAHTSGFNRYTSGVAVLGTHTGTGASTAARAAVAHLALWRLNAYGRKPTGTATLVSSTTHASGFVKGRSYGFAAVSAHRDAVATACPGNALYAQMPGIRTMASRVTGLALSGITGATRAEGTYYTKKKITVSWKVNTPSRLIARHQVLIDGAVVTTTTGRSAVLTPPTGRHTLRVRTTHRSGNTALTPAVTLTRDATAPTFATPPTLKLRTGVASATALPVTLSWKATDNTSLRSVTATAPRTATFPATTSTWRTTVAPGSARTFTLRARDAAGNTRTLSTTRTPVSTPETSATRTGTWTPTTSSRHLGGAALTSTDAGATLTWTVTGRAVAWVTSRTPTSGRVRISLDGRTTTVDLHSTTTAHRQVVWARSGLAHTRHTVRVTVLAPTGGTSVTSDGLLLLR